MNISIVETTYSEDDIVKASELVLDAAQKRMIPQVSYVTGSDDGNSLLVAFAVDVFSTHSSVKLQNEISLLTSMNVEVKEAQGPEPAGRQNDSAPWFGGGMMEHPNFNPPGDLDPYIFCSTGFSVLLSNGYGRLLSARHCDTYGNLAWKNGQHDALTNGGDDVDISETDDSMLIDPVGGTAGWVHGGPWNASSSHPRYHLKVANAISPSADAFMCTSGANSGEHCGLQVINSIIASWTCEFGGTCHGWLATESSTTLAIVGGDSGGPAYSNRTDGRVTARGIIYGGSSLTDCGQVRFSVSNCYSTVYIVGIERLLNLWAVTIETTA